MSRVVSRPRSPVTWREWLTPTGKWTPSRPRSSSVVFLQKREGYACGLQGVRHSNCCEEQPNATKSNYMQPNAMEFPSFLSADGRFARYLATSVAKLSLLQLSAGCFAANRVSGWRGNRGSHDARNTEAPSSTRISYSLTKVNVITGWVGRDSYNVVELVKCEHSARKTKTATLDEIGTSSATGTVPPSGIPTQFAAKMRDACGCQSSEKCSSRSRLPNAEGLLQAKLVSRQFDEQNSTSTNVSKGKDSRFCSLQRVP